MKTNLRERLTRYQSFIRPKVHFAPEFSFNGCRIWSCKIRHYYVLICTISQYILVICMLIRD